MAESFVDLSLYLQMSSARDVLKLYTAAIESLTQKDLELPLERIRENHAMRRAKQLTQLKEQHGQEYFFTITKVRKLFEEHCRKNKFVMTPAEYRSRIDAIAMSLRAILCWDDFSLSEQRVVRLWPPIEVD